MNTLDLQVRRSEIAKRLLCCWQELDGESEILSQMAEDLNTPPSIRNEVIDDRQVLLHAKSMLVQAAARFNERASRSLLAV